MLNINDEPDNIVWRVPLNRETKQRFFKKGFSQFSWKSDEDDEDGVLPPVAWDDNAPVRTYVEKNRFHWDLDSSIKQAGIRHINFMSLHFAEKSHLPLMILSTVANLNGSILLTPLMNNCWMISARNNWTNFIWGTLNSYAAYFCKRPPIPSILLASAFSGTKAEKLSLEHLLRPRAWRRTLQHMDLITWCILDTQVKQEHSCRRSSNQRFDSFGSVSSLCYYCSWSYSDISVTDGHSTRRVCHHFKWNNTWWCCWLCCIVRQMWRRQSNAKTNHQHSPNLHAFRHFLAVFPVAATASKSNAPYFGDSSKSPLINLSLILQHLLGPENASSNFDFQGLLLLVLLMVQISG